MLLVSGYALTRSQPRSGYEGHKLTNQAFHSRIVAAPVVHDGANAARLLGELERRCADEQELAPLQAVLATEPVRNLLAGVFGASPYLTQPDRARPGALDAHAGRRAGGAFRGAVPHARGCRCRHDGVAGGHAGAAPVQERRRPADGAGGSGRHLAGDDGDAAAVGGGRCRGRRGGALPVPPGGGQGRVAVRPARRLHRARHGQVRSLRAQLLVRHRLHRLLRSRPRSAACRCRDPAFLRAPDARPRPPAA